MEKQNKTFIITLVIFIITAVIALCLVLNKGKVFGYSLVSIDSNIKSESEATHKIELSSEKEYLSVKDEEESKLTVLLDGAETLEDIEYVSSNEEVAIVENGVVKAIGVGNATITAKYEGAEDTVDVKGIIPIENIKFTSTSSSIRVGNQLQLKLQVTPSDANIDTLIYSSSDDETATVNKNGIVTGKTKGKVVITVHDTYTGEEKSVKLTIR